MFKGKFEFTIDLSLLIGIVSLILSIIALVR